MWTLKNTNGTRGGTTTKRLPWEFAPVLDGLPLSGDQDKKCKDLIYGMHTFSGVRGSGGTTINIIKKQQHSTSRETLGAPVLGHIKIHCEYDSIYSSAI